MINPQITAIQSQIDSLKKNKTLSSLDEFLIMVWERNISILGKNRKI